MRKTITTGDMDGQRLVREMTRDEQDAWFERRQAQLVELEMEGKDVLNDEKGDYVMVEDEDGFKKVYLD